ncbi:MAG: hypothetical protein ABGY41_06380 [Candidatus Poribacteria bacterium]
MSWGKAARVGVVDFDGLQFPRLGRGHENIGGFGFVSDDPATLLKTTYDVYRGTTDVVVLRGFEDNLLYTFTTVHALVEYPGTIAVHRPTDTVYLTGVTETTPRVWEGPVLASPDGGKNWTVVGEKAGQLYVLTGRDALFLQTDNDLLTLPLAGSVGVAAAAKAATTWGAIKQTR